MGRGGDGLQEPRGTSTIQELTVMREMAKWRTIRGVQWFSSYRVYALPFCLFPYCNPPGSLPVSPSHGFLGTLFSSDTGRMATGRQMWAIGMLETRVESCRKSGISSSHELGCFVYASTTPYLLMESGV